jgi:hypothetical protein
MDDLINVSNVPDDVSDNEEVVVENETPEPLIIENRGAWQTFEIMANVNLIEGHTYQINVNGICEFATGVNRPTSGLRINSFPYTKGKDNRLWIKTN